MLRRHNYVRDSINIATCYGSFKNRKSKTDGETGDLRHIIIFLVIPYQVLPRATSHLADVLLSAVSRVKLFKLAFLKKA